MNSNITAAGNQHTKSSTDIENITYLMLSVVCLGRCFICSMLYYAQSYLRIPLQ